ncbi:MAG TPA: tyrosine-type recombinase/integrase [Actinomycetota bacterium]|nr:tyrosine-type recombinase/integrase [Actinomycetota bacterium]
MTDSAVGPHRSQLRHTAAALMIDELADPLLVQRQLGHDHVATTLSLYGHLFPERDEQLSERLDARFRSAHAAHADPEEEAR